MWCRGELFDFDSLLFSVWIDFRKCDRQHAIIDRRGDAFTVDRLRESNASVERPVSSLAPKVAPLGSGFLRVSLAFARDVYRLTDQPTVDVVGLVPRNVHRDHVLLTTIGEVDSRGVCSRASGCFSLPPHAGHVPRPGGIFELVGHPFEQLLERRKRVVTLWHTSVDSTPQEEISPTRRSPGKQAVSDTNLHNTWPI